MSTVWKSVDIRCPFYRSCDLGRRELSCEACSDAMVQVMRFTTGAGLQSQIDRYCTDLARAPRCGQYRAVMEKYGG